MSKLLEQFKQHRSQPSGDMVQMRRLDVINNWNNIEYCIKNRLPVYGFADTQSGKTFLKFWLADEALKKNVVDNVIISTTNLTGAMCQIRERAIQWAQDQGRQVKSTDDKTAYMVKDDIFINMTNTKRTQRIDDIVMRAEENARKNKRPLPRILVIIDEGEEFHEGTETSNTDTALGNLLIHNKHNIRVIKVSATLLSHVLIHSQFSNELQYLRKEQVWQIGNHPFYQGLSNPNFIEPLLQPEGNWNSSGYTQHATLSNTHNPRIITKAVESLINDQKHIGDSPLTKKLVQIGNIVAGDSMNGHAVLSNLLSLSFTRDRKLSVTTWDNQPFSTLNQNTNVVIIIHNGNSEHSLISEKLSQIACGWNRDKLKAILIVSKKMTGKSISIECKNWDNPKHPEFGFYANFTAYYGKDKENITVGIQAMRCTGIRPGIKKHVMFSTDETKQDIENYKDQINRFVGHLNQVKTITQTQLIDWVMGTRPLAKGAVQKGFLNNTTGNLRNNLVANNDRSMACEGDMLIPIDAKLYHKIVHDQAEAIKYAIKNKFNPMSLNPAEWDGPRVDKVYDNADDARNAFKNHSKGRLVKMHWVKLGNRYHLYIKNNMNNQTRTEYHINELKNGRPTFASSKLYKNNDVYQVKVK